MKKIFISFVALAAIAACSKTEVQYENSAEIAFAPAVKNITKAAINSGYPDQPLRVFANYGELEPGTDVTQDNIDEFETEFLKNAKFIKKTVEVGNASITAWGGEGDGYSWPNNGSLVFAGYAVPTTGTVGTSQTYDFTEDKLEIAGYTQSTDTDNTFDLAWFGRTVKSHNNKTNPATTVNVTLSHALSWIEIQVKGEGTTIAEGNPWRIKTVTMNNVANTGNVACVGSGANHATWSALSEASKSIAIFSGDEPLSTDGEAKVIENVNAGTLVIPQTPTAVDATEPVATLTVTYTYNSPAGSEMPTQTTTVPLVVDGGWKSGNKYIYTLTFKSSEILVVPTYDAWDEVYQSVTVE